MSTCSHGNLIDFNHMLCPQCRALMILDLAAGATVREIRDAYRILVKVWHPDRFVGDEPVRRAAETKLKEINTAYTILTDGPVAAGIPDVRPAEAQSASAWSAASGQQDFSWQSAAESWTPNKRASRGVPVWVYPAISMAFRVTVFTLMVFAARDLVIALDLPHLADKVVARFSGYGNDSILFPIDEPASRFRDAVEQDMRRIGMRDQVPTLDALAAAQKQAAHAAEPRQTGTESNSSGAKAP